MDRFAEIKNLVFDYPRVQERGKDRWARHWLVRTTRELPDDAALDAIGSNIENDIATLIRETFSAAESPERLSASVVGIAMVRIDEWHCVVGIEVPIEELGVANAGVVMTFSS